MKINPKENKLIGIHGLLESGKDTAAQYMINCFPNDYKQYAFAWPIKDACQIMFNFSKDDMNDRKLKELINPLWGITPRKAMQLLGTEYGRKLIRKDVWIIRAQIEIEKNLKNGYGTIISDVRFDNEAEIIRNSNGIIFHIERPKLNKNSERYNHESEYGIKKCDNDITILNNSTILDFQQKIKNLFIE